MTASDLGFEGIYANSLDAVSDRLAQLPFTVKVLLENVLRLEDDRALIGGGLTSGDVVITSQLDVVSDGMKVRVITGAEGVYLTEFTQNGRSLLFRGYAESSTRVSALMRNIDSSPYLGSPVLQVVQSGQQQRSSQQPDIGRRAQFALAARQLSTTEEEGAE